MVRAHKYAAEGGAAMSEAEAVVLSAADPFHVFGKWFDEATAREPADPTAMTLATSSPDGVPTARMVLLKGTDSRGFIFYSNARSRKGENLAANPRAALVFYWPALGRQVRIEGQVEPVGDAEADAYFASRPRISKLGAWASDQSRPLADNATLERRVAEMDARFPGDDIPRPPHWRGWRVVPERIEFWRDMPYRLHERTLFTRAGDGWTACKLFP
jgi:pyridoxamine 5'-phosphate oxidase